MAERVVRRGARAFLFEDDAPEPKLDWFDREPQRGDVVAVEESGRGAALVVRIDGTTCVLRHYRRGGLVSRFVEERYLWLGLDRTRAFREWRLLRALNAAGLPVPRPVAAHVLRIGASYTADLLTELLPSTRKMATLLDEGRMASEQWEKIGRMLAAIHGRGVDHPDLTAQNILIDARGEAFLVDFDNARLRAPGPWRDAGIERLKRSLRKLSLQTGAEFDGDGWTRLVAAYEAAAGGRRLRLHEAS
jgi:3-deoxy-D-manno-octulosonic acid kinase